MNAPGTEPIPAQGDSHGNGNFPIQVERADREAVSVLVVDDERTIRESCASLLTSEGYSVVVAGKGEEAVQILRRRKPDIALVDLYMSGVPGMKILEEALKARQDCLVIVMTGKPSVESSIEALRAGAWSYLPKPFSATHFNILMGRATHTVIVGREAERMRTAEGEDASGLTLLGESDAFKKVIAAARQVAPTDASVFIHGESGTGKELIAQFIHQNSRRRSRELVTINSAAIPENLLESEMFGHVEGAFTGAVREKKGLLEMAHGSTLFLDEIGDMPHPVQAKLLRVIQDGVVRRVGSTKIDAVVNVRFIAATNVDPVEAMRKGNLREDLHYRLRVFPIWIPPLRNRPDDVPAIANHYLSHYWSLYQGPDLPLPILTEEACLALRRRPWPGNIRELRNVMEHSAVVLKPGGRVRPEDIPFLDDEPSGRSGSDLSWGGTFPLHEDYRTARDRVLAAFEVSYLKHIMMQANGKLTEAANIAGVDRTTLYRLMERHGISREDLVPHHDGRRSD